MNVMFQNGTPHCIGRDGGTVEHRLWKSRTEIGNSATMMVTQWNNNGKTVGKIW